MTNMKEHEAILHATLLAVRAGAVQVDQAVRMLSPLLGGQPAQADLHSLLGIPSDLPDRLEPSAEERRSAVFMMAQLSDGHWYSRTGLAEIIDARPEGQRLPAWRAVDWLVREGRLEQASNGWVRVPHRPSPDHPDLHDLQKLWLDALRQAGDWARVWTVIDDVFATVEYGPAMDALAVLVASGVVEWEEDEVRLASPSC